MFNPLFTQANLAIRGGLSGFMQQAPLLIDLVTGAAAAYSTRKLRATYSGSAIRVRRSSDNSETDIGFTGDELDTTALLAHCGAGSGFVVTWYDQSGNARHLEQATAANQPRIVNTGVLDTIGGKPVIIADGVNDFMAGNAAARSITNGIAGFTSFILGGWVGYGAGDTYALAHSIGSSGSTRIGIAAGTTGNRRILARRSDADSAWSVNSSGTYSAGAEALVSVIDFSTATGRAKIRRNNVEIAAYTNFSGFSAASITSGTNSVGMNNFATNASLNGNYQMAERIDFVRAITDSEASVLTVNAAAYYGVSI